ncbi:MAG: bacteriohemerythrin [Treponema sp.]|jgi:hemerythrin|nr:bacteriohemerythrin [Treponema sp.]
MIAKDDGALGSSNPVLVTWEEKYVIGIELIDTQHKELLNLTNELYRACLTGEEGPMFKEIMHRMVEYVRFHFNAEQKLLEKINYPLFLEHKKQHDDMVKSILDAAKDFNEGKKFVANNFVRTLKDWVFGHIALADRKYAAFVDNQKKKGLLTDRMLTG